MLLYKVCNARYLPILTHANFIYRSIRAMESSNLIKSPSNSRGVSVEELFRYSSGRWLINEKQQLAERYVKFDVDELCQRAASVVGGSTSCSRIDKMEGSFNKAFLLTMGDGREVVAKIPCPNAGQPHYTTASEVATLKLLRSRTSIPVPKVLAWDANSENPVGAEYIILEKVAGVLLSEKWSYMSDVDRYKLIERIVEMEKELAGLRFPAYGSLYLRESLPPGSRRCLLDSTLDPSESLCIGPLCHRSWWEADFLHNSEGGSGPWTTLTDFAIAKTQRAVCSIQRHQSDNLSSKHRKSAREHIHLLERTKRLIPILESHPVIARSSSSVLWHTDLHLGNIFVSTDDPTVIEGIIDWQSLMAAPLFLQCRVPVFLEPPADYVKGIKAPELPADFDQLDSIQQQRAIVERDLATRWKIYEMYTLMRNHQVYSGLQVDRRLWEPFRRCGNWSNDSVVSLRSSLIRIFNDWDLLGLPGKCPFTFTDTELEKHEDELKGYLDRIYLQTLARDQLCTNDDGWIPLQEWDTARAENQRLLDIFIETMADEMSKEDAMRMWPFWDDSSPEE